ncbi:MFS transporter [Agromyces sp. LHK192]|uniref:MFS transporter n=1 Tax=Agromyces sp. LHK192 TaxID=2498704 RepID=UPI001F0BE627|nr:MFS transporter [Agromyces sp. LHK192]
MTEQPAPTEHPAPTQPPEPSAPADGTGASAPDRRPGVLSAPYRWLSLGMFALIVLAAFEALAVTTVMPLVADDLDGWSLYAIAFSMPLASGVIGMVVAGNWVDRAGPIPPLIASAVVWLVGVLIAGTATSMELLVVGRFVHGLGGAAVIVPLYVVVARVYPEYLRARVFAGFAAAWVIPSIVGPAVAGLVAEAFSWHWVFLGVLVLVLPVAAMILPPLARAGDQLRGDASVPWSVARIAWSVLAAVAALGLGLSKELPDPWRGIAAVAAIAVVVVAARPLVPRGTLTLRRGTPAIVMIRAFVGAAFFATEVYLPAMFREQYGMAPALAGAVLTGAGLSWALASWLQGRLVDRVSDTAAVRIGTAVLLVALTLVLTGSILQWHPAFTFAAWTIAGAGMGFMYPRFTVAVLADSSKTEQGFNSAALTIGESLGSVVGITLTALVASVAASAGYTTEFVVTVFIAATAALLAPRVRPAARVAGA